MIWIISLNSSFGHIYSYEPKKYQLKLLETLENPAGKLKTNDLISDVPGHYKTSHSTKGAYAWPSDPHDVEVDRFTKNIVRLLKKGHDDHHFTQLILCAAPHVGGILLSNLDKQVKQALLTNIKKNFVEADASVLTSYLKDNWWDIIRSNKV
jgi:protein required for attachment to host cells